MRSPSNSSFVVRYKVKDNIHTFSIRLQKHSKVSSRRRRKKKQQTKLNRADDKAYNDKRGIITANCRPDEQRKPIRNKSPKSTFIVQSCYRNLSKARHRGKPRGEGKSVNKMENPKDGQAL